MNIQHQLSTTICGGQYAQTVEQDGEVSELFAEQMMNIYVEVRGRRDEVLKLLDEFDMFERWNKGEKPAVQADVRDVIPLSPKDPGHTLGGTTESSHLWSDFIRNGCKIARG